MLLKDCHVTSVPVMTDKRHNVVIASKRELIYLVLDINQICSRIVTYYLNIFGSKKYGMV